MATYNATSETLIHCPQCRGIQHKAEILERGEYLVLTCIDCDFALMFAVDLSPEFARLSLGVRS